MFFGIDVICIFIIIGLEKIFPRRPYALFKEGLWKDITVALLNRYLGPQLYYFFPGGESFLGKLLPWGLNDLPQWAEFLIALIIADFGLFMIHWNMHRTKFGRNVHKLHHTPREVSATSGYRNGYGEEFFMLFFIVVPMHILKVSYEVMDALFFVFAIHGYFLHSNIDFRMPKPLRFICCPHFHQWHHIKKRLLPRGHNMGATFTVWDKMFGTYIMPEEKPDNFGLPEGVEERALWSEYFYPASIPVEWIKKKITKE